MSPVEAKRIRAATGIRSLDVDALPQGTPLEERTRVTWSLLEATRAFAAAYEDRLKQG